MYNGKKITVTDVLNLLKLDVPEKTQFYIDCPYCDKHSPGKHHLSINVVKDVFNCPKCENGGSAVPMYGFFVYGTNTRIIKADKEMMSSLSKEIYQKLGQPDYVPIYNFNNALLATSEIEPVDVEIRSKTYQTLLDMLPLNKSHEDDLLRRGLTKEDINRLGYKSTPQLMQKKIPGKLRAKACDLLGVPGFYREDDEWNIVNMTTGYFVPVRDLRGNIQGMQIRSDRPGTSKYIWLSSASQNDGSGAKTWCHFSGYPEKIVLLTEGPLKGDIINKFLNRPVIAVPGVNALSQLKPLLEELKSLGVEQIDTAFDMDFLTNIHVQNAYEKLLKLIQDCGLRYRKLIWDDNYKGYDDYLLHLYQEAHKIDT